MNSGATSHGPYTVSLFTYLLSSSEIDCRLLSLAHCSSRLPTNQSASIVATAQPSKQDSWWREFRLPLVLKPAGNTLLIALIKRYCCISCNSLSSLETNYKIFQQAYYIKMLDLNDCTFLSIVCFCLHYTERLLTKLPVRIPCWENANLYFSSYSNRV